MTNTSSKFSPASDDHLVDMMSALSPHGRWRDWLFMTLRCYIDESESVNAKDPAVCVVGYLAQGKKWQRFSKDWNKVLDSAPKRVEVFHATDFAGRRGKFRGWTDHEYQKFINALIRTVHGYRLIEFGCAIHRSTFNQVVTGKRGRFHGNLHLITATLAMMNGAAWALAHDWKHAPSFFVESGSTYYKGLRDAHRILKKSEDAEFAELFRLSAFSEVPKSRQFPQTQPADMLAFYASRWTGGLVGYDPEREDDKTYFARLKPDIPNELARLLPIRHNIEYHTPQSLDKALTFLERGTSLDKSPSRRES
jgi:hypothetical protein